jgi:hypothetical protein
MSELKEKYLSPQILILTTRNLKSAPRVYREIKALYKSYNILCVGTQAPDASLDVSFIHADSLRASFVERLINISRRLLLFTPIMNRLSARLSKLEDLIVETSPVVVISHEPHFLPYLNKLKSKYKFRTVYNAHEYHPLEFSDKLLWRIFWQPYYEWIYRTCLKSLDLFINICDGISELCEKEFEKKSIVIPNASVFHDLHPKITKKGDPIRIIHHGACIPSRKIEFMVETGKLLGDKYQLDMMLTKTHDAYYEKIKSLVSATPNVRLLEPVSFESIVPETNKYDIGLILVPPSNVNYYFGLPNKFFEFIQARLCLAIGPLTEMCKYVDKYDLGVISKDFTAEDMADSIRTLSIEQINQYKLNSHKASPLLSAELFNQQLADAVKELI